MINIVHKIIYKLFTIVPAFLKLPVRYMIEKGVEPELYYLKELSKLTSGNCAIDIGANHGIYTYGMQKLFEKIVAFEANTNNDFDLRHYKNAKIRLFNFGLSDSNAKKKMYIPIMKNGAEMCGWASFEKRNIPGINNFKETIFEVKTLDSVDLDLKLDDKIAIIKIDVESHEMNVLRGAINLISAHKPLLIIENNDENVNGFLNTLGYKRYSTSDLLHINRTSANYIYLAD